MKLKWQNCTNEKDVDIGLCALWTDNGIRDHQICAGHMGNETAKFLVKAALEHEALIEMEAAWMKFKAFYFDDLCKNNKGFIGNLLISDFGIMNEAYLAVERAEKHLSELRK